MLSGGIHGKLGIDLLTARSVSNGSLENPFLMVGAVESCSTSNGPEMTSPHSDIAAWTAGAQRVWEAAHDLAARRLAETVTVEHLLWGLLCEENRAAERLLQAGVSRVGFEQTWGDVPEGGEAMEPRAEPLPPHDLLEAVFIEARAQAFQAGTDAELGTEHLLVGICRVPSDVSTWLAQFKVLDDMSDASQKRCPPPRDGTDLPLTTAELQAPWRDPTSLDLFDTYRILDAAANRAREGLRVVEDFVRWAWNDGFLSQQLKECRHELAASLRHLPLAALLTARDTQQDVGTEIRTASEYCRTSPADVATASLKRLEEALRSLEEYSKIVDPELSARIEQLRYRVYTIEKSIHATHSARLRLADHRVCLLATHNLCHHGLGPAVLGALQAGVRMIQLREKSLPDCEFLTIARLVRTWTNDFNALLIVNDRPDLAALTNADGVHVGQDDLPIAAARKILGPDKLVGVSTHSLEQVRQAVLDGADYLGVGPCFPSATKKFDAFPGLEFVRQVAAEIELPWFAIGGITAENLPDVMHAGATRIAVSGAICSAEEPGWAARELAERLSP